MSDPTASIAASTLVADFAPYALALVPVVIGWGVAELRKYKIQIGQAAVAKLDSLADAEAGAAIAASETNLAGVAIRVGSAPVADAVARIVAGAPGLLAKAGYSPEQVATKIAGKIGVLQANAPAAPAK